LTRRAQTADQNQIPPAIRDESVRCFNDTTIRGGRADHHAAATIVANSTRRTLVAN
jgi:hypothetical protein